MTTKAADQALTFDVETLGQLFHKGFRVTLGENEYMVSLSRPEVMAAFLAEPKAVGQISESPTQTTHTPHSNESQRKTAKSPTRPRKARRRRQASAREKMPDSRELREFLANHPKGGTLTMLAREFNVKRATIGRLLDKLIRKEEVVIFRGAYYNNRRLRRRRAGSVDQAPIAAGPARQGSAGPAPSRDFDDHSSEQSQTATNSMGYSSGPLGHTNRAIPAVGPGGDSSGRQDD